MDISYISNKITNGITNELNYSEDKKEIIVYAIESIFLFILGGLLIILFGYSLNALIPTVIATAFGGLLRKVSGGAHFDAPLKCTVIGAIVYSSMGVMAKNLVSYDFIDKYVLLAILFVPFVLVAFLAPVDSESKPIHSSSLRLKLRISSILFVIFTFLMVAFSDNKLVSVSAVLGLFYQSVTLLPTFNKGGEYSL